MAQTFGDRLKILRKEHGMTMDEFIKAINSKYPDVLLNKSIVSRYENNIHTPKKFTIVECIADFFDVDIKYMMGKSDDKYGEEFKYKEIPILKTIDSALPILAQKDIYGYEYVLPNEDINFCIIAKGDSMINARIFDNDIVYIRQQNDVNSGEIAAIEINNEISLKRVYYIDGNLILRPENPNYKDLVFSKKDKKIVKILGKAISFKSEVK